MTAFVLVIVFAIAQPPLRVEFFTMEACEATRAKIVADMTADPNAGHVIWSSGCYRTY